MATLTATPTTAGADSRWMRVLAVVAVLIQEAWAVLRCTAAQASRWRVWWLAILAAVGPAWLLGGPSLAIKAVAVVATLPALLGGLLLHYAPMTHEARLAGPIRRYKWRKAAPALADQVMAGAGMAHARTRRNLRGDEVTEAVLPKIADVQTSGSTLRLTITPKAGQSLADVESLAPALAPAFGAHSVALVDSGRPDRVAFELMMRSALADPTYATVPDNTLPDEPITVCAGVRESGEPWHLQITGRPTLIAGITGAGKGSVMWSILCGLAPGVASGHVRIHGVDLKYGIEMAYGHPLMTEVAETTDAALDLLARMIEVMDARGEAMRGVSRMHVATPDEPLHVLAIDELAALIAYTDDRKTKAEAERMLSRLLTAGRALGVIVVAALQDARKEVVTMRSQFAQVVALRVASGAEVSMILGEGAAAQAPAHRIPRSQPGRAYVVSEDGRLVSVRASYWSDDVIRQTARRYSMPDPVALEVDHAATHDDDATVPLPVTNMRDHTRG